MQKRYRWLIVLGLFSVMHAQTQESTQGQVSQPTQKLIYCPEPSSLVKDPVFGKWSTQGGWYSQEYSFASKVDRFDGAVFRGNDIGRITCQYSSTQTGDRMILLKNTVLVKLPTSQTKWQQDKQNLVKICQSSQLVDCPFMLYNEDDHKQNINQTILSLPQN